MTDVSQRLLAQYGGVRGLFRMEIAELARIRGLGDAKAVRLKAALELGRRLAALLHCLGRTWDHTERQSPLLKP